MAEMQLRLVSPEGVLYDDAFDDVVLPSHDGLRGILPGHAPFVGRLGIGLMRLRRQGKEFFFGIYGGFLQVTPGRVEVVVDRAERPEDLDPETCRAELEALHQPRRFDVDRFDEALRLLRIAEVRRDTSLCSPS